jgi:hypothetical protein
VEQSASESANPYRSPAAAAEARGKVGWLAMLLVLWPIVMASVGCIIGFFIGRLASNQADPEVWNPATMALGSASVFAVVGLLIGARKASVLRGKLDVIHNRREELRHEMQQRLGRSDRTDKSDPPDNNDWVPGDRVP